MDTLLFTGIAHPGLLTLWNKGSKELQWKVFCAAISPRLDPNLLTELPPHLVIPAAALSYLRHVSKIIGAKIVASFVLTVRRSRMASYKDGHVHMVVCMFQLENCWVDSDEFWYESYAIGRHSELVVLNFLQTQLLKFHLKFVYYAIIDRLKQDLHFGLSF
jgi:hypothetical protein